MRSILIVFTLSLSLLAGGVQAQYMTPEEAAAWRMTSFAGAVRPTAGVYFDPGQSGTGLTLDTVAVGQQVFFFGTYYHYTASGEPTWLNMGQPIVQRSAADYAQDGIPATVGGEWDRARDGQCMDCVPRQPLNSKASEYGTRQLLLLGARELRMPAAGAAPAWNARLARDIGSGGGLARVVHDPNTVWQAELRYPSGDTLKKGWHRFRQRVSSHSEPKYQFLGYNRTNVSDGQGGALPSVMPAWLDAPNKNTADHWELHCAYEAGSQTTGLCPNWFVSEPIGGNANDLGTWLVDPQTGVVRYLQICGQYTYEICDTASYRRGYISGVGDVIELEADQAGVKKFAMRYYNRLPDVFAYEYLFTRIDPALVRDKIPNFSAIWP